MVLLSPYIYKEPDTKLPSFFLTDSSAKQTCLAQIVSKHRASINCETPHHTLNHIKLQYFWGTTLHNTECYSHDRRDNIYIQTIKVVTLMFNFWSATLLTVINANKSSYPERSNFCASMLRFSEAKKITAVIANIFFDYTRIYYTLLWTIHIAQLY